ncbi:hypothetical protein BC567DRAFT_217072 [Phyllosticta citribraziliensis]
MSSVHSVLFLGDMSLGWDGMGWDGNGMPFNEDIAWLMVVAVSQPDARLFHKQLKWGRGREMDGNWQRSMEKKDDDGNCLGSSRSFSLHLSSFLVGRQSSCKAGLANIVDSLPTAFLVRTLLRLRERARFDNDRQRAVQWQTPTRVRAEGLPHVEKNKEYKEQQHKTSEYESSKEDL